MTRLIFSCICIICFFISSCNNNQLKTSTSIPAQEKQLRDLVEQYPDSLILKENLVEYFRQSGDYRQAITETETALKKDSLNANLLSIKATLHFEDGDTMGAIKAFEKAISINPQPEYVKLLGSIYAQTKNPMALKMADALLNIPAATAQKEAIFIKGLYYNYSGDKMRAISLFDSCLKMDYRYMLAYREKAICLYDLGKYMQALNLLKQAVAVQNNFDEGYYWMGKCYEKLDNKKEAIGSYRIALQSDSNYVEAKEALERLK